MPSSWNAVIGLLQRAGYTVYAPPNPLEGLAIDTATLADFLHTITGPIVLVGHSYGGEVITNAATGDSQVKALVYDDACRVRALAMVESERAQLGERWVAAAVGDSGVVERGVALADLAGGTRVCAA